MIGKNISNPLSLIRAIKFLDKSWAPNANATPNNPKPANIGPTLIFHISRIAAPPKGYAWVLVKRTTAKGVRP